MERMVTELANVNSGSYHTAGLNSNLPLLKNAFAPLGGTMRDIALPAWREVDDGGNIVSLKTAPGFSVVKRPRAPLKVFLGIHYDTVFPADTNFLKVKRKGRILRGPGVTDAKGGLIIMLKALEILEQSPWAEKLGWEVFVNPDEEIGSPASAGFLNKAAARNHLGLLYEPSLPDGTLVGSRKGSGVFTFVVRGKPAHVGREYEKGRSALYAMARLVAELEKFHAKEKEITVNIGEVKGGGPVNVVPDLGIAKINARVWTQADMRKTEKFLNALRNKFNRENGISVELHGEFRAPPKPESEKGRALLDLIKARGKDLKIPIKVKPSGGVCDGNRLAAAGLPNMDTMGAVGGNIHSPDEYLELDSLVERASLSASILLSLARDGVAALGKSFNEGGRK